MSDKWIAEISKDFEPRFQRMDGDRDLYNQIEYRLKDIETGKEAKDVVNITMNDAKVFADRAQAFMNEANMQTLVEGKHLGDKETTLIESFDSDIRFGIDQLLMARDINSLFSFLVEQSCIRGTVAGRYICWDDEGLFTSDLLPCDSRYLVYEYGRKDLTQAAFRTVRTKASIEEEYPGINLKTEAKKYGLWEYWSKDKCQIWLGKQDGSFDASGGQLIKETENIFGYVPFIIQGVGAGSMLQDEEAMRYHFESIFASNRLLYPHLNMLGSILQTLNYMSFNRPHLWESEAGTQALKPPKATGRKTTAIDKGTKGLFPMPLSDVQNATRLFYSLVLGAIQRGSLSNIDYGNLTFPLSAVAISKLTATKDAIFAPRLQAISLFYRKLHYMIKDQYIKGGYEVELGEEGMERIYNASDLDKKYKIWYKFHSVSPEQDIANFAIGQQARALGYSFHTVLTSIMKHPNPDGEIMKARAERAEQLDPVVALFRYGLALIDQGTEESFFEADLVEDQIERLLRQRYAPPVEEKPAIEGQVVGTKEKTPKSLVPLLEGGGGARSMGQEEEQMWASAPEEMMRREERRGETVRKHEAEG